MNKLELLNLSISKNIRLNILFTLTQASYGVYRELGFKTINTDMAALLERIVKKIK